MAPERGDGRPLLAELRRSCSEICAVAQEASVNRDGARAAAASLDLEAMRSLAESPKTLFPLRFDTVEDEVNFLALLNLLDIGEDYRALLKEQTGEGAHETLIRGMLGFSLSGKKLDAEGLCQMSAYSMEQALGVKSKVMQALEGLPGEIEVDGPLAPLVQGLAAAARYIGDALKSRRQPSLGRFILDVLGAHPLSAEAFVAEVAEAFPALSDQHEYAAGLLSEGADGRRPRPATGDRVMIEGLASRPDLNGKSGRLGNFDEDGGRWEVYIDAGKPVKVKPDKLQGLVEVAFHGRALATAAELWRRFGAAEPEMARLCAFTDIRKLTAQGSGALVAALRHLGAVDLDAAVAASVDAGEAVERSADCAARAAAVMACEAIVDSCRANGHEWVTASLVDAFLWGHVAKQDDARRLQRQRCCQPMAARFASRATS